MREIIISEQLADQSEVVPRSPETQQIIDATIDRLLVESVRPASDFTKEDPDQRALANTTLARYGLRRAAVVLATEIDGTQHGIDHVASFYADLCLKRGPHFYGIDELQTAYTLAMNYEVSPEVAEKVLLAKIYACHLVDANDLANNVLGRNLRDDELLTMVDIYTHGASRSNDDRNYYLEIATGNGAGQVILQRINRAFDDMDERWQNDLL
ncbi:MAG: hypothetical protein ABSB12_00845 [Candidatus Saccharimonadales bacterium]|jgi:hypothetical protein